jgi:Immunoglobulin-like domain of bacterial spore germination
MQHLFRFSLLAVLLALVTTRAYAQPACPSQPANPDGTTITSPTPDQVVTSPLTVQGNYFGSFEGVVPIRVLDANGAVLVEDQAMNECCILAPYERQVTIKVSAPTSACVVVYRESGADGSLTPLAQVPVTIAPGPGLPGTSGSSAFPAVLALMIALTLVIGGGLLRRHITSA